MQQWKIFDAPGNHLIPVIIKDAAFIDVEAFYRIRTDLYKYPLVSERISTYSIYHDLIVEIKNKKELLLKLIDYALLIAEKESNKKFLCAIFFITEFSNIAKSAAYVPTTNQIEQVIQLRKKAQKLSVFPNMSCFWNQVIDFIAQDPEINSKELLITSSDYLLNDGLNLQTIGDGTSTTCPVSEVEVNKSILLFDRSNFEPIQFVRSAIIDDDKYWLWYFKCINNINMNFYGIVKHDNQGAITYHKSYVYEGQNKTGEQILLSFHYS